MTGVRVLMVAACPLPWPRGTPIRVHRMAEALQAAGQDVCVATYPVGDSTVPIRYAMHRAGPRNIVMDTAPGPSVRKLLQLDPHLLRTLRGLLASRPFDVVHAHHYEGLITSLLARAGRHREVPVVFDCHTLLGSELPQYRLRMPRGLLERMGRLIDGGLPRRADHVIAVSPAMRDWLMAGGGIHAERVSLIPNGVEHEHFRLGRPMARRAGRIAFAGNLAEYQGLDLLFAAFRHARAAMPEATLELLTDGEFDVVLPRLRALGLQDAVVCTRTDYASLPRRLAEASVLANPRVDCDGIPQKVLNYMAAGRGIVSFASSRGPLEHERTGLVVADGDVAGFAEAMLRLLRESPLADRLGAAARDQVIERHGWHHVAEEVTEVYRRLLDRRP